MAKLDDLTPQIYLNYKRHEMTDQQIAALYDCSCETLTRWKKQNGLSDVTIHEWETWEKYFPDEVEKLKKRFLGLYNKGWKHIYIAEELKMTRHQLTRFKERYFPEIMRREHDILTEEQKRIAKQNGIRLDTVRLRIKNGWNPDDAIRIPPDKHIKTKPNPNATLKKLSKKQIETAIKNGISRQTLLKRLQRGWTIRQAISLPPRKQKRSVEQ